MSGVDGVSGNSVINDQALDGATMSDNEVLAGSLKFIGAVRESTENKGIDSADIVNIEAAGKSLSDIAKTLPNGSGDAIIAAVEYTLKALDGLQGENLNNEQIAFVDEMLSINNGALTVFNATQQNSIDNG